MKPTETKNMCCCSKQPTCNTPTPVHAGSRTTNLGSAERLEKKKREENTATTCSASQLLIHRTACRISASEERTPKMVSKVDKTARLKCKTGRKKRVTLKRAAAAAEKNRYCYERPPSISVAEIQFRQRYKFVCELIKLS